MLDAPDQESDHASMGPRSRERGGHALSIVRIAHITRASMGPRSRERGGKTGTVQSTKCRFTLQWGRAHVSAEGQAADYAELASKLSFNGAALT